MSHSTITHKIKPAGGGDFTTLALWDDYADGDGASIGSAAYHAECYKGGNLGKLSIGGWTHKSTPELYPKIYAAPGEEHGGDVTDGAYLDTASNYGLLIGGHQYIVIQGLRINGSTNADQAIQVDISSRYAPVGLVVERCLIHGSFQHGIEAGLTPNSQIPLESTSNIIIRNNLVRMKNTLTSTVHRTCIRVNNVNPYAGTASPNFVEHTVNANVSNNTCVLEAGCADAGRYGGIAWSVGAGHVSNITLENNFVSLEGISDRSFRRREYGYRWDLPNAAASGTINLTASNNAQGTNNSHPLGSGSLVGFDPNLITLSSSLEGSGNFVNPTNGNYKLGESSLLVGAGKKPTSLTTPFYKQENDFDLAKRVQPQNLSWDIGCFEFSNKRGCIESLKPRNNITSGSVNASNGTKNFENKKSNTDNNKDSASSFDDRIRFRFSQSAGER